MKDLNKIIRDIKELKVQGAENIAKAAAQAFKERAINSKTITKTRFFDELEKIKKLLMKSRPTEPCMRNCLNFITNSLTGETVQELKNNLNTKTKEATTHLENAEEIISEITSKKIKNGSVIFTHCHSSTVVNVLKKAKKQGKKFEVHNTETRPKFQGRTTEKELLEEGIPVTMYVDSAARFALKKADLFLLGADAITSEGKVINKMGSELFAEVAVKQNIPIYICADSWKFDAKTIFGYEEELEKRSPLEVWKNKPKKLKIDNFAFEKINPTLITGIISELGVYKPGVFVEEIKRKYFWMFN